MKKNIGAIVGLVVIAATLAFCATSFKSTLISYVPISEAKAAGDASVQIMAAPVAGTTVFDSTLHALRFVMDDGKGGRIPVIYRGPKPEDFDTAAQRGYKIVAQGSYDTRQQAFVADTLLVKCPSKYQGKDNNSGAKAYAAS